MQKKKYPDDLSDTEWSLIESALPKGPKFQGHKPLHSRREMLNAMFYVLRTGCAWRHLPHDFPRWNSVYLQFRRWQKKNVFEQIHHCLRKGLRRLVERAKESSVGIVDSQSIKTTEKGGSEGLTEVRKLKAGKDTYWLITWEC